MRPPARSSCMRAETVGSLLRPAALLDVRRRAATGEATPGELRAAEDEAVVGAVALPATLGLGGPGWEWHGAAEAADLSARPFPFVVRRLRVRRDLAEDEYAFRALHAHTPTKYCIPAPSYHRTVWHPEHSRQAYPRCEDFLLEMRDYVRDVVRDVVDRGCRYVQLDAPNYGNLCDAELR